MLLGCLMIKPVGFRKGTDSAAAGDDFEIGGTQMLVLSSPR